MTGKIKRDLGRGNYYCFLFLSLTILLLFFGVVFDSGQKITIAKRNQKLTK